MPSHFGTRGKYANTISCLRCGKTAVIKWQDAASEDGSRELIAIEGGFYERLQRKKPYNIELVCLGCGTAQDYALHP
jgi:hypothetical protein